MTASFTDRELDVMAILWELGSGTVADVHERLADEIAYTTVLTTLRNMEVKGYVTHREEGRQHRFFPAVPRQDAGETAVNRVVNKFFGGSMEMFLTHLLSRHHLPEAEVERLEAWIREQQRGGTDG